MKRRRLAIALHAVSTSPAMPRWPEYVARVQASRHDHDRWNAPGAALTARLLDVVHAARPALGPAPVATDLVTALASFVDDYSVPPPRELFEVPLALRLLEALVDQRGLTVDQQLALALDLRGELFPAVLALHTATRVLARGRDSRLHPGFALGLDERLERGRAIAPFDPSDARGGDPLGDTYHFWANVAAGLYSAHEGRLRGPAVAALFLAGPALMTGVRERLFDNYLFFGSHARVDRLGLATGRACARAIRPDRAPG
ncbi:MAG: hypothetical protein KC619_26530 [Myxococcales bacterium]|nr:hypothetical protein [Myxococcales bacterium]